eukprot:m.417259 g.417259  ORF g.417259 m.417259 type:complete len:334 (-) comp21286_c0_seq9:1758-2759(-)
MGNRLSSCERPQHGVVRGAFDDFTVWGGIHRCCRLLLRVHQRKHVCPWLRCPYQGVQNESAPAGRGRCLCDCVWMIFPSSLGMGYTACFSMVGGSCAANICDCGTLRNQCIPLVAFSYQCHVTCPLVYNSMKNRSIGRMRLVIVTCISICVLLYVPTAIAGYYMLGEATPSDVLNGFCKEDSYYSASAKSCVAASDGTTQVGSKTSASIMLSQICMFLSVACSYGLLTFVCRTCICDFIMGPGKKFTRVGYHLETICFVAVTVLAAMFIPDLSIPMEFGGIIVVIQCILFPGLVKLKICETATDRAIGYGLVVIGVCMAVVCLICAVHDSMNQ